MDSNKTIEYIRRTLNGDTLAFSELYKSTINRIYFICLNFLKNEHDANDVVQEIYLIAYKNLHQLTDERKFKSWLERIAVNKCRDFLKKNNPIPIEDEELEYKINKEAEITIPDEYIIDSEKRKIIITIMRERLSDLQYQTLILYYFNNLTIRTIAETMECSEGAVKNRLSVARSKIKEGVRKYEKDNDDKLYSFTGISFLALIFQKESENTIYPDFSKVIIGEIANLQIKGNTTKITKKIGVNMVKGKVIVGTAIAVITVVGSVTAVLLNKSGENSEINSNSAILTNIQNESKENMILENINSSSIENVNTSVPITTVSDLSVSTAITTATTTIKSEVQSTEKILIETEITTENLEITESYIEEIVETQISELPTESISLEISKEAIIEAYGDVIEEKNNYIFESGIQTIDTNYTLFDMNNDNIPELIVIYQLDEVTSRMAYYTYDENGIKLIEEDYGGGHGGFSYDTSTNQFVYSYGHMGSGGLIWMSYENDEIVEIKRVDITYSASEEFEEEAKLYNVENLSSIVYNRAIDTTFIFTYKNGEFYSEEYDGYNHSFLEKLKYYAKG